MIPSQDSLKVSILSSSFIFDHFSKPIHFKIETKLNYS